MAYPRLPYEPGTDLMDPKRPNFTMPREGSRMPFDVEAQARRVVPPPFDEVPRNLNVGKGMPSAEAKAYRAPATVPTNGVEEASRISRAGAGLRGFVNGAVGKLGAAGAGISAAVDGFNTPTEDYAKRFGAEGTEPSLPRDLGLRALGAFSDIGNAMTFGQAGKLFRDKQPQAPQTMVAGATAAAPTQTDVQRGGGNVVPITAPRTNSFGNVTSDTAFDNRGQVSDKNIALADAVASRSVPRTAFAPEANLPAGYGVTLPASQAVAELEARNAGVRSGLPDGLSARQRENFAVQREQTAATSAAAAQRDATERRGQELTDAGFQRKDKVTMRGQDMEYGAKVAGNETARTKAILDARKEDRTFKMEEAKLGVTIANANADRRDKAETNVRQEVASMFKTPDGKPDEAMGARFIVAAKTEFGRMQADMEKRAAAGDPKAAQVLKVMGEKGLDVLDQKDKARLFASMQLEQAGQGAAAGPMVPWGGSMKTDNALPATMRQTKEGWFGSNIGGEFTTNRGDVIPARTVRGGWFGNDDKRFEDLITK